MHPHPPYHFGINTFYGPQDLFVLVFRLRNRVVVWPAPFEPLHFSDTLLPGRFSEVGSSHLSTSQPVLTSTMLLFLLVPWESPDSNGSRPLDCQANNASPVQYPNCKVSSGTSQTAPKIGTKKGNRDECGLRRELINSLKSKQKQMRSYWIL